MKRKLHFYIYQDTDGLWRWHTTLNNITADGGEGYDSRWKAKRAVKRLIEIIKKGLYEIHPD